MPAKEAQQVLNALSEFQRHTPAAFASRADAAEKFQAIEREEASLSELEAQYLMLGWKILTHPGLATLARRGRNGEITFAMIKPNLYEGKNFGLSDTQPKPLQDNQAADAVRNEIEKVRRNPDGSADRGEILLDINMQFTPEQAKQFYAAMESKGVDIFGRIIDHMSGGPVTVLLLRHQHQNANGEEWKVQTDAVTWWRERIGRTDPRAAAEGTIRRRFARTINNNIVHGSDSKENVIKEAGLIGQFLCEHLPEVVRFSPQEQDEIRRRPDAISTPREQLRATYRELLQEAGKSTEEVF